MPDSIKVLIVDDDLSVLALLEEVFSDDPSLQIKTMSDSLEAYNRLERESFDLIITDLMMPEVDGLRLLERALSLDPNALVVMVTGYASLETTLEAIHMGVYDYITKPFRVEEFRLLVYNAAARIRLVHENRALQSDNREMKELIRKMQARLSAQEGEIRRMREETGRLQDLPALVGGGMMEGGGTRVKISSYERGPETSTERFDRELRHFERLFSEGRLTPEEFEMARQRLKTLV
jgi:DNA-binding NtrC family response regulator